MKVKKKYYILHKGKKLYYPANYTKERIVELYRQIGWEQDPRSPHYYWGKGVVPQKGDVLVDIGAAEGIVVLENIDLIKRAILVECESHWVDALNATFQPYRNKVDVISSFCGAKKDENTITVDELLQNDSSPIILKIDVEGAELDVLSGASKVLNRQSTRLSVAAYHKADAEREIVEFLHNVGNTCETSEGYMLFVYCDCEYKGIIRSYKA